MEERWLRNLSPFERENAALREQLTRAQADELDYGREVMALHERLAAAERENGEMASRILEQDAEIADQHDALAAAEQREQQARAIIEAVAELDVQVLTTTDRKTYLRTLTGIHDVQQIHDQARAWLADRAEQRAVERFGDTQSWRPDALHRDILAAGERIGTEQEASE